MSTSKVVITTSGIGSRLKSLTKNTNKALVKLNDKPIIDYIISSYPPSIPFVITTRYLADQVEKYLSSKFPHRHFTFSREPDRPPSGAEFSLGCSLLAAKKHLQTPFIFQCCDTIVTDPIPEPSHNWSGGSKGLDPEIFNSQFLSSFSVDSDGYVTKINPKGAKKFDLYHIGLVGIHNYQEFWKNLQLSYNQNPKDTSLNDVSAMSLMIKNGIKFKAVKFPNWYDTGNMASFGHAKKNLLI